jgi:dephospho-CoA kinase
VQTWRSEGRPVTAVIIPLLYETHAETDFDAIICVACSSTTQRQRLRARGWPSEQIEQRIQAQLPVEHKIARADYLIWTDCSLDIHASQLDCILRSL